MADKDQGKRKKESTTMPLHAFLESSEDQGGSWADRSEDIEPSDRPAPRGGDYERGGDRYGDRGDRYGDRGGDRYGGDRDRGDRYGDRGDRYGDRGDRYDRGGDRYDRGGRGGDRYSGGGYRDRYEDRAPRAQKPVPDQPPFIAYVGNLSFSISEDELFQFFKEGGCNVKTTRIVTDFNERSKGFGYVEFEDKESLEMGLDANEIEFAGRRIRVDVADAERSTKSKADAGDRWERGRAVERSEDDRDLGRDRGDRGVRGGYRRGGAAGDRGGYGGGDRGGYGGYSRGGYRDDGAPRDRAERGRPSINLTRNVESASDKKAGGSNPFGSATPIVSKADKIFEKEQAEKAAAEAAAAAAAEKAGAESGDSKEVEDATSNKFEALKLAEESNE